MKFRNLIFAAALCLLGSSGDAQQLCCLLGLPLSGNPIGAGIDFTSSNRALFVAPSASLETVGDLTIVYEVQTTAATGGAFTNYVNSDTSAAGVTGLYSVYNGLDIADPGFQLQAGVLPSGSVDCSSGGNLCTRSALINDGGWHMLAVTLKGGVSTLSIDAIVRDQNAAGVYAPSTSYWQIGQANSAFKLREVRKYHVALTQFEIQSLYNLYRVNLVPSSGTLTQNLDAYWPMSAGTISGDNVSDTSGNNNTAIFDHVLPTVAVTAPTNGATISGASVALTATASDNVAVANVVFEIDGLPFGAPITVAPYTATFDSTLTVDGSHTITAVATDVAGNVNTATTITVTTSNSIVGVQYFVSSSTGNDANNGTSAGTAWATLAKVNASNFHAGDSILFREGDSWTESSTTYTNALLSLRGAASARTGGQNVFTSPYIGSGLTLGTFGGGTCNTIAGTISGCATFNVGGAVQFGILTTNVDQVAISKIRVIGATASSTAFESGAGFYVSNVAGTHSNVVLNNVESTDFSMGVYAPITGGVLSNVTIENSYLHGSTLTTELDLGIWIRFGLTNSTVSGNLIENIGGRSVCSTPCYAGASGNGILIADGASNITDQFNVTRNSGRNTNTCGGPVGNWAYHSNAINFQFNESYGMKPTSFTAGCDWDGFDLDAGVQNSFQQYNYSHDNFGSGLNGYTHNDTGFPWTNNIVRYNVSENDSTGLGQGAIYIANNTNLTAFSYIYNNTVYLTGGNTVSGFYCWALISDATITVANNLCMTAGNNLLVNSTITAPHVVLTHNGYWRNGGSNPLFRWNNVTYTSLAAYQTATGQDAGSVFANPSFSSAPPFTNCYSSGTPAGPQPCPAGYALNAGSPMIGVGLDLTQAPYNLNVGAVDYYGTAIPNGVGSGFNIGADGAHH